VNDRRRTALEAGITVTLLVAIMMSFGRFAAWVELRPGVILDDPLLRRFAPRDLTWPIFVALYGGIVLTVALLWKHPARLLAGCQAYGIMVLFRIAMMWAAPLDPPPDAIPLADPFVSFFGPSQVLTRDLFFSGHTATCTMLVLAAPYPIIRLVFFEELGLFLRMFADSPARPEVVLVIHAVLVVLFTLLSLPFAHGLIAVAQDAPVQSRLLQRLRTLPAFGVLLLVTAALMGYLSTRPVYSKLWDRDVRVEQRYRIGADSSVVEIRSSEYLDQLAVNVKSRDTLLQGQLTKYSFVPERPSAVSWLKLEQGVEDSTSNDTTIVLHRTLVLRSALRPYIVEVHYYGRGMISLSSPWSTGSRRRGGDEGPHSRTFTWYSFPDSLITLPLTVALRKGTSVAESITVTYDTLSYPVRATRALTSVRYRTVVTASDTLRAARGGDDLAGALD